MNLDRDRQGSTMFRPRGICSWSRPIPVGLTIPRWLGWSPI